jgi:hypothetical protein
MGDIKDFDYFKEIKHQINILFGFIGVIMIIFFTKGDLNQYPKFLFVLLFVSLTLLCYTFFRSTYNLTGIKEQDKRFIQKLNNLIRTNIIMIFLTFTYFIINELGLIDSFINLIENILKW